MIAPNTQAWLLACIFLLTPVFGRSAITVIYSDDTDLREVAKTHLGDANLWPLILKVSGVESVAALVAGNTLEIPVSEVESARLIIAASLGKIQQANAAGAQLFAYKEITEAVAQHDSAMDQLKLGNWDDAIANANNADKLASDAIETSNQNRDQAAEARLSDRHGSVEGQRSIEPGWKDRLQNAVLIEEEQIRTLSQSTAQITFRDAGRLRLSANSHAVIQRMRVDPLKRREDAKVSLVEGDFYALLGADSSRNNLEVDIPGAQAQIESGNFWVQHDTRGAKFTNYDDDLVRIAASGSTIELGRNEGVVIRSGKRADSKVALLRAPNLVNPENLSVVYSIDARLSWNPVPNASAYWLEVSLDAGFNTLVYSLSNLTEPAHTISDLDVGVHYWRVYAIDQFDLPGQRSQTHRFEMRVDNSAPYLMIQSPLPDAILRIAEVEISGESEPGAVVVMNGNEVDVATDGSYQTIVTATEGENRLVIIARDLAGNQTTATRNFTYMPDSETAINFDDLPRLFERHFVATDSDLSLSGTTTVNARIEVTDEESSVRSTATSDSAGVFSLTLPLKKKSETFSIKTTVASGFETYERFQVTVDNTAPVINLESLVPRLTSVEWLQLHGTINDSSSVSLNGKMIAMSAGEFDEVLTLRTGINVIEMTATDIAGNVTVQKWQVVLDRKSPAYIKHTINSTANGRIAIEVFAQDASGLSKSAPFTLLVTGQVHQGFLRYNKLSRSYKGSLSINAVNVGKAVLSTVELTDNAGNHIRVKM